MATIVIEFLGALVVAEESSYQSEGGQGTQRADRHDMNGSSRLCPQIARLTRRKMISLVGFKELTTGLAGERSAHIARQE